MIIKAILYLLVGAVIGFLLASLKSVKKIWIRKQRKLIREALNDDNEYPQDHTGNTKLTLLMDKIKLLRYKNKHEYLYYVQAINDFSTILEKLSFTEIQRLCNLISGSDLMHFEYCPSFLKAFQDWRATNDNLLGRMEIFRLIAESGAELDISFLDVEDIKNKFPWYWIDAAFYVDREQALTAIKEWLTNNNDFKPVLQRLPHWYSLYNDKDHFLKMLSTLKPYPITKEDKETIDLFIDTL